MSKVDELIRLLLEPDSPVPTPCFVIDLGKLRENCGLLAEIQADTGAKILLALKAFSAWSVFSELSRSQNGPLYGTCASSVDEARLGSECFGGETHAFAAAWKPAEITEIAPFCDHLVFNSLTQWRKLRPVIEKANASRSSPVKCGLRINPEHSEGAPAIYNPCSPGSRLGIRLPELAKASPEDIEGISGLHFHTLCEQGADALARTLEAVETGFSGWIKQCEWLNWGGGHHITKQGYDVDLLKSLLNDWRERYGCQIYLEPGEAVALNAGWLIAEAIDIVSADLPVAILDISAACHTPDVLEMPYTPEVWTLVSGQPKKAEEPGELAYTCRLAGKSCLAGDVIGEYSFENPILAGERLAFADMAIYSMVKTNTFNGLRLPAIAIYDPAAKEKLRVIKEFGYTDFKNRLS